jgi:hypothetical protein
MKKSMRSLFLFAVILLASVVTHAQQYQYAPSESHPYGLPNPKAPMQIKDFAEMIGTCHCKSVTRIDQQTWSDTLAMTWTFKYIMNGMAVQDETYKADGLHSGSIRQYSTDSSRWYVYYYAAASIPTTLPAWEGGRKANKIVLTRDQRAPNGMDGHYRLTFNDISERGYNWAGEWVSKDGSFVYPTWRIFCRRTGG